MVVEIPRGALLTTETIRVLGHESPRFRQAGLTEYIPFMAQEPYVHLVAQGLNKKFRPDLFARVLVFSDQGVERWRLDEQPDFLQYHLHSLTGTSMFGRSLQEGDRFNFHLLRTRPTPEVVSVADLDVNRALVEHDPLKTVEFLSSTAALIAAIHHAHTSALEVTQRPNRLVTAS